MPENKTSVYNADMNGEVLKEEGRKKTNFRHRERVLMHAHRVRHWCR